MALPEISNLRRVEAAGTVVSEADQLARLQSSWILLNRVAKKERARPDHRQKFHEFSIIQPQTRYTSD